MSKVFYLYTVRFAVKWTAKGKRSNWDEDQCFNVVAGEDAREALRMVERKAKTMTMDDSELEGGAFWRAKGFRLISIAQGAEVTV